MVDNVFMVGTEWKSMNEESRTARAALGLVLTLSPCLSLLHVGSNASRDGQNESRLISLPHVKDGLVEHRLLRHGDSPLTALPCF